MNAAPPIVDLLNQLLILHKRSLPRYLDDAAPYVATGDEAALAEVRRIADAHELAADRLAELVIERDGTPAPGEFPLPYSAYHDLSFRYLLRLVIAQQQERVARIERLAAALHADAAAQAVAEELLGEARGQLDNLRDLTTAAAGS